MTRTTRTLVVGVAAMYEEKGPFDPPGEDRVLAPAAELARRLGAVLHVVHVFQLPDPVLTSYTHAVHLDAATVSQEMAEAIERRLEAQVARFDAGATTRCRALEGSPRTRLCEYAEEVGAELLIIGATRRSLIWRRVLGSTAEQVLQRSSIPVLVMRRPFRYPVRRVLLTTDLSEISPALHAAGLATASTLFSAEEPELRTLLVCWMHPLLTRLPSPEYVRRVAADKLDEFLQAQPRGLRLPMPVVRLGNPSTEIVREAEEWKADLLVLGSHGRGGVSRLLLGSTAMAALRDVSCNSLVIPAAPFEPERTEARDQPQPEAAGAGHLALASAAGSRP